MGKKKKRDKQMTAAELPPVPKLVGDEVLLGFFSDESAAFRTPAEPDRGQRVVIRLRVERGIDANPVLVLQDGAKSIAMEKTHEDELFAWHEAHFHCPAEPVAYRFIIRHDNRSIIYQKGGVQWLDEMSMLDPLLDFQMMPGFHTPEWAQGALMYQILPDRFANGNPTNDVRCAEYVYGKEPVQHVFDWDAAPSNDDYRCFYGGDLAGVAEKLDYLQSLGVEAIYFNPLFVSPSSHGYDVQDYDHIDPHYTVISNDLDHTLEFGETTNENALAYIQRTTLPENLEKSDEYFADFCAEVHRRGMRIILDGVFNHCGSFSPWLNREGIYRQDSGFEEGAYESTRSPYRHYFNFDKNQPNGYESWWGFPTLPKLNYEQSPELCERIIGIACKWAKPPYSVDGWRLDVAADLGHSAPFNHRFWREFRKRVKDVNPDLLILAEHYGDPSPWLQGSEWDSVMNYDAFMEPLTYFLTGMEKHSDFASAELYQDGVAFYRIMNECMARFSWPSLLCAMNELSNHDHSRFLTRTNRMTGRIESAGSQAAAANIDKRVLREAVAVQMTWPGAPTIYYGDEAGQVGWTDPDCRRTYPWGREDWGLIELHRTLARIRHEHPCLRKGSFVPLGGGTGWIAFGRFEDDDRVITVCNNADYEQWLRLRVRSLGAYDGCEVYRCLATTDEGFLTASIKLDTVEAGMAEFTLPARSALVAHIVDPD